MKKFVFTLALAALLCAFPTAARAGGFTWETPYGSGSFSSDDITQSGSASGSGERNSQTYSWGFAWDLGTQTADVNATYADNVYAYSFSWADIFAAMFGI